jgi:hypothetical protein
LITGHGQTFIHAEFAVAVFIRSGQNLVKSVSDRIGRYVAAFPGRQKTMARNKNFDPFIRSSFALFSSF